MSATVGRNDPCSCGSGKKYKKCCLRREDHWLELDLRREKIRTFLEALSRDPEFNTTLLSPGSGLVIDAWEDFPLGKNREETPRDSHDYLYFFLPWFLYRWHPGWLVERKGPKAGQKTGGMSQVRKYCTQKGAFLPGDVRTLFTEGPDTPLSGFIVRQVRPGRAIVAEDLLTHAVHEILDVALSRKVRPGDCFFGLVVSLGPFSLLETPFVTILPPIDALAFIKLRNSLEKEVGGFLTRKDIDVLEPLLLTLYGDVLRHSREKASQERPSVLVNTDREPVLLHTLHYGITSCQRVFDALQHLALDFTTEEEILAGARRDEEGNLTTVQFRWFKHGNNMHPTWTNTIMGVLSLTEKALEVEVNSEKRAEIFQTIARKTLKGLGTLRKIDVEKMDPKNPVTRAGVENFTFMNSLPVGLDSPGSRFSPEARAFVLDTALSEQEKWLETANPLLDGKKPLDVRNDPDFREFIEILLYQKEKDLRGIAPQSAELIVGRLYERMGWSFPTSG